MADAKKIRLLVVDDHPVVLDGLCAILGHQPDMAVVATAEDCRSAVREFRKHTPDVALMDLHLPDESGIVAITKIHEIDPRARTIVLSTYSDEEDVMKAVQAGAAGYLLKDCKREVLVDTVRDVYRYKTVIPTAIASQLAARIRRPALTERELEVLELVAAGKANKEIAAALNISPGTAKAHIYKIMGKLKASSRTEAAYVATQIGILRPR